MVRGTMGVAVPVAEKPLSVIVRGPGVDEADGAEKVRGAFLGPASLAGTEVGGVTVIVPGVTL